MPLCKTLYVQKVQAQEASCDNICWSPQTPYYSSYWEVSELDEGKGQFMSIRSFDVWGLWAKSDICFFTIPLSALWCVCAAMSRPKGLSKEDIAAIVALYRAGKCNKETAKTTGQAIRSVQRLMKCFVDGGGIDIPTQKKLLGWLYHFPTHSEDYPISSRQKSTYFSTTVKGRQPWITWLCVYTYHS